MKQFKGIYAALMTPFSKDGKVNFDAMGKLIDRCIRSGVNGFYVCGSTGEGVLLSVRERNEIYAFVGEYAAGRAKLIAHVGSLATRDAVAMAKNVRKCGFDAVSAVPPFYYAYGFEEIAGYYRAIADAAELPVIVYNFPNAGTKFTIRDIEELFRDARFAGIKHTSQDLYQLEDHSVFFRSGLIRAGILDRNDVGQFVVRQHIAVPVVDIAPGPRRGHFFFRDLYILVQVFLAMDDLQLEQMAYEP